MEAYPRGHIEAEVGVVDAVQPPQHRHRVKQNVLEIDRKVEQDHRQGNRQPARHRERVEKAPSARLGEQRQTHGGKRKC